MSAMCQDALFTLPVTFTTDLQGAYSAHFTGDAHRGYVLALPHRQETTKRVSLTVCVCYINARSHVNGREERFVD